jgi:hypothetical protein
MSAVRKIAGTLLLFLLSVSSFPGAQSRSDARLHLLSAKQGEDIVQAAWELRRGMVPKPDCSHFVHAVYAKAGFSYGYAVTGEVFTGIDGFRRVQKPQPGDLVVWQGQPGHIGIVVDPGEHSFYSSVLSGFAIENYQSKYWLARGYPRFYRFVVNPSLGPAKPVLTKVARVHPAPNQPALQPVSNQKPAAAVAASPNQAALQPGSSQKAAVSVAGSPKGVSQQPVQIADSTKGASRRPVQIADSTKVVSQQPAQIADSTKDVSRQPAQIAVAPPAQAKVDAGSGKMATRDAAIPNEILVTSQATPSRREVLAAIIRLADDNSEHLLRDRLLDSQPSVGVADDFRVVSLDVQGKSGLAEVEVKQIAAFRYGKPTWSQLISRRRLILSRQQQGWILLMPQDLLYLTRRMAAAALTDQLTALSKAPADQLQAKKTSKMLHELLSEKSAGANTGSSQ